MIAVVGLGLVGGSLARAWSARGERVLGVERDAGARAEACALGAVAEARERADASLRGCDLVVLAVPVPEIVRLLREEIAPFLAPGAVVTDVGGAKKAICDAAAALPEGVAFVGAHPMMGSEKSGFAASRADLLSGGAVAVCPCARSTPESVQRVESLWRALGNGTVLCDPAEHDAAVARASHLPYLAAAALCLELDAGGDLARALAGPGFRDATRVAEDPTVALAAGANDALRAAAESLAERLLQLALGLGDGTSRADLKRAAEVRRTIR
jgi:prephenate dehydrogenase